MTIEQAQTKLRITKTKIFLLTMDSEQEVLTSEELSFPLHDALANAIVRTQKSEINLINLFIFCSPEIVFFLLFRKQLSP